MDFDKLTCTLLALEQPLRKWFKNIVQNYLKGSKLFNTNIYSMKNKTKKPKMNKNDMRYIENQIVMTNIKLTVSIITLNVNELIHSNVIKRQILSNC